MSTSVIKMALLTKGPVNLAQKAVLKMYDFV